MINILLLFSYISVILSSITTNKIPDDKVLEDRIYDEYLKSVRIFPNLDVQNREHLPPAISLNSSAPLLLVFDDLYNESQRFLVKFIHCNSDWTQSQLFPLDYLDQYNEFTVLNYEHSFNTLVNYTHYYFNLPRFKLPGNYVLQLYREGAEDEILMQKRFMIFDNRVRILDETGGVGLTSIARMNQGIRFSIDYERSNFRDPYRNLTVTIRQNQRWDNMITNLRPTFIKEDIKQMDFNYFSGENEFTGGNQFRFFDLRSLQYFGRNVETVKWQRTPPLAYLQLDKPRTGNAYAIYQDFNGKYMVSHPTQSDYAEVVFTLESEKLPGKVYIGGELTNWEISEDSEMYYDEELKAYRGDLFLKQGYYDYQYLLAQDGELSNFIEGDHFQTENDYEILVYYRSMELNADLLVGFFSINSAKP